MKQSKSIAIITARGGSKRIPRKNIRNFLGKPIIAYSIEVALKSKLFDEVMVSTDDEEISKISEEFGAKVPFRRSEMNSNDYATTDDVLNEVLLEYRNRAKNFDYACCIYPTAPLLMIQQLIQGFELLTQSGYDTVFPVVSFGFPIFRSITLGENNRVSPIWPENMQKRSQDLPAAYHDAGQFYWFNVQSFLANRTMDSENSGAIIFGEMDVQDIDNLDDWKLAELKFKIKFNL